MTPEHYQKIRTVGELRNSGYEVLPVKEELRRNLIAKLRTGERLFPGIVGYDDTVIPMIVNAILARHDIIFLGLRGQAKTRMVRMLTALLDERIPIVRGSEINDNPFRPVSKYAVDLVRERGEGAEIEWIPREQRYGEKLATPDVTIADLIGDIDPIKAATQRLHYSHEGAINFGLIPRTNRGIFAINELPDLQPRIQVGLFNILQEKDIQIRGFNIRIPLDLMVVFTANPEDYTNRGSIITPLKDRIGSQILTHYPQRIEDAMDITAQEAWIDRSLAMPVRIPPWLREIVERIAFQARSSDFVDQKSGVSARLAISTMELLVSNAERRAILNGETAAVPRVGDLGNVLPGMTGKLELVFEGEQEGTVKVGRALVGKAIREVFARQFPDPLQKRKIRSAQEASREARAASDPVYGRIINWFEQGNRLDIADTMAAGPYLETLRRVDGLEELVRSRHRNAAAEEIAPLMEFVLEGLHQNSRIAKETADGTTGYRDLVGALFTMGKGDEDD